MHCSEDAELRRFYSPKVNGLIYVCVVEGTSSPKVYSPMDEYMYAPCINECMLVCAFIPAYINAEISLLILFCPTKHFQTAN